MPTSFVEGQHDWGFRISEANGMRSRETITIAQSGSERTIEAGRLLGRIRGAVGEAAAFAAATDGRNNTGNGVISPVAVALPGAKEGTYKLVITEPGANVGTFLLFDPDGLIVGSGAVATVYAGPHLAFTLADGSTDFVAGDGFNIVVAAGTKYSEWDEDASNGTEIPAAILGPTIVVPAAADVKAGAIVRDAEVNAAEIKWPASGTDAAEKAAALSKLMKATGIIAR